MTQLITDDGVAGEEWVARIRELPVSEQADMLAGAARLLRNPEAICTPLESELLVFVEQVSQTIGQAFAS